MSVPTPQGISAQVPSKGRRIWRRTWVGLLLTGLVVALLAGAWASHDGTIVWAFSALVVLGCCAEVGGMGGFAGRGFRLPLLVAGAALVAAVGNELLGGQALHLGWRYLEALALALLVASLTHGGRASVGRAAALGVALGAIAFHLFAPDRIDPRSFVLAVSLPAAVLTLRHLARADDARERLLLGGLALWLVAPLFGLLHVWWSFGAAGLTALVILSKIGDILGYYVGNALGRSHPFPRISPGKTTAGCVGSLLGAVAVGGALVPLGLLPAGPLGIFGGLLAGLVVNLAAQAGDLLESAVKRKAGVKDSGRWFGPAGGLLDLFDSLLLSIPMALLAWPWILGET